MKIFAKLFCTALAFGGLWSTAHAQSAPALGCNISIVDSTYHTGTCISTQPYTPQTVDFQMLNLPAGSYSYAWDTSNWDSSCSSTSSSCSQIADNDHVDVIKFMYVTVTNLTTSVATIYKVKVKILAVCGGRLC